MRAELGCQEQQQKEGELAEKSGNGVNYRPTPRGQSAWPTNTEEWNLSLLNQEASSPVAYLSWNKVHWPLGDDKLPSSPIPEMQHPSMEEKGP